VQPELKAAAEAVRDRGWAVLEDVAPLSLFDRLQAALDPLLAACPTGRNPFEGHSTQRVNNLLAKGAVFQEVAANPGVLDLVEAVLGPHFQISIISAIQILPGETAQDLHTDDGLYPLPWPHPPVVLNTMWAIDDFTEANGATVLVPDSHQWPDRAFGGQAPQTVPAAMARGSVLAWVGNLVHGGGANRTDRPRLGITMNYNQAWLRQQENQYLGIPMDVVQAFPERLQRLVGYDLHPPFIGNVDGRNPLKLVRPS